MGLLRDTFRFLFSDNKRSSIEGDRRGTHSGSVSEKQVSNLEILRENENHYSQSQLENKLRDAERKLQQQNETIENLTTQLSKSNTASDGSDCEEKEKKLQTEIKKLKRDLDDAQDDLDDAKSKFKKEKAQLELSIVEKESEAKKLLESNELLHEENEDLQKTIKSKNTSLEFVQEILTAKSADKEEEVRAYQKAIDDVYNFIDGELYSCITNVCKITKETEDAIFGTGLKHWALNERKTWIKGKTTVALIGEFSSGKTSIVNRLLSQDKPNVPLLPVSTKATTAIPTYISGGVATNYRYYSPENQLKSITEQTFTKVNKEVLDEVKGASQLIKYFVMTYNNPILNGLSVLDTPGFLSNDVEDTERTIEVINECDALFWVFDVNKGQVGQQSLKLIKDNLAKPLFVIINKIDTKSTTEVDKVENLLKSTFAKAGVNVHGYLRFSHKAPLSTLSDPLQSIKSQQQQENYVRFVIDFVSDKERELASSSKQLQIECNEQKKFLDEQYAIYQESFKNNSDMASYAASIPHWEEHWFCSDRYEMSSDEYSTLKSVLDSISEDTEDTYEKFPALIKRTQDFQKEFENLCTIRANHSQVKKCLEKLIGLSKKLK